MDSDVTLEVPQGKYNRWCEKRTLVYKQGYNGYFYNRELTYTENAALFLHETVGCEGLEFVVFSNAEIDEPIIELPGNITLIPCFMVDLNGAKIDDQLTHLTFMQMEQSRYIYDGWMPISDWKIETVKKAIGEIDQALSLFSLLVGASFTWEPKYPPYFEASAYGLTHQHIHAIKQLKCITESLEGDDLRALFKSIAWFSQSFRLSEPTAKFLFCILAIESLATYIETNTKDGSAFKSLRSPQETTKDEDRINCIHEILDDRPDKDLIKAVNDAYVKCVLGIGTKAHVKNNLKNIFGESSECFELLFKSKGDGDTLYKLRNKIAHGTVDALSEKEREIISARLWDVERLVRRYILKVLEVVISENEIDLGIETPHSKTDILPHSLMYRGPFHMAEIYRNHRRNHL